MTYALVIHGGAGAQPSVDYTLQIEDLGNLIRTGGKMLKSGHSALDTVTELVAAMEVSGLYVAGKGSGPNTDGIVQLDASIMDGANQSAGAVSAVRDIVHPIKAARHVMEASPHVLLTPSGARSFALEKGIEAVNEPASYYIDHVRHGSGERAGTHGTVGAVALDLAGNLAAATSTGGTFNKLPGRVGDTPLIGAGTWADDWVAVSGTGVGEAFIRTCASHDVAARMRYGGMSVREATDAVLEAVKVCDGDGGLIAVDRSGNIAMPFNSQGMKRAAISNNLPAVVRLFEPEPVA